MQRITAIPQKHRSAVKRVVNRTLAALTGFELALHRPIVEPQDPRVNAVLSSMGAATAKDAVLLDYGVYDTSANELHVIHDAGLYSCLSVTLWCLTDLLGAGLVPEKINFEHTLKAYKDDPSQDIYPVLFSTHVQSGVIDELRRIDAADRRRFDHHGAYRDIPFRTLNLLSSQYLRPSRTLSDHTQAIREHSIRPGQRYLGICFRGTDKGTEILPVDSSLYLEAAERLLSAGRVDRILIQTDQEQVRWLFKKFYGDRCDSIEQLPRTRGTTAIHNLDAIDGSRLAFAKDVLSAVTLLSEMEQVIVYTGNMGAWVPIVRGSTEGVWQATNGTIEPQFNSEDVHADP